MLYLFSLQKYVAVFDRTWQSDWVVKTRNKWARACQGVFENKTTMKMQTNSTINENADKQY